ncbi:hypothetical protein H2203_007110 [Taxawa tesnikishii (nom. ined.)]|nr:hypothetical protein H2203_007110 [Dothideales sp. JES 119]
MPNTDQANRWSYLRYCSTYEPCGPDANPSHKFRYAAKKRKSTYTAAPATKKLLISQTHVLWLKFAEGKKIVPVHADVFSGRSRLLQQTFTDVLKQCKETEDHTIKFPMSITGYTPTDFIEYNTWLNTQTFTFQYDDLTNSNPDRAFDEAIRVYSLGEYMRDSALQNLAMDEITRLAKFFGKPPLKLLSPAGLKNKDMLQKLCLDLCKTYLTQEQVTTSNMSREMMAGLLGHFINAAKGVLLRTWRRLRTRRDGAAEPRKQPAEENKEERTEMEDNLNSGEAEAEAETGGAA